MAKQFNVPFDESEEILLEDLKDFIKKKGYKSQKEWLKSKIAEDTEPEKTNKNTIKITDYKGGHSVAPQLYAPRINWVNYMINYIVKSKDSIDEFDAALNRILRAWNFVIKHKDSPNRLEAWKTNPKYNSYPLPSKENMD